MTVSEFRSVLEQVGRLLGTAGVKATTVTEIEGFASALERFGERRLSSLAELLGRMDETGAVAAKPGRVKAASAKAPGADPQAVGDELRRLYDRAAEPATTEAEIGLFCDRLNGLTIPGLKQVAGAINFAVPAKLKSKADIIGGIRHRILDRRGASIRSQLGDRTDTHPATYPTSAS